MPHIEHKCVCGKKYTMFRYYKEHILKHKCRLSDSESPLNPTNTAPENMNPTLSNPNMNLDNTTQNVPESVQINNEQIYPENVAYKSSHKNINPKATCNFCDKLYSTHHIKTHKLKCKYRYKDCHEYKLLVRAGITNIPETYIEVIELSSKLNETTPQIFMNLPPDRTQLEGLETARQQIGRPRKVKNNTTSQVIGKQINNITNNNITNNNITNNNQQINVFINPICQESLAHITPERQMFIILQRLHAFKALIDSVYETPANHNICISDRKGEQVKYLDAEHGINNGNAQNIIGDIAMSHLGHLDNFIETHKNEVPEHRKNDLKFLEAFLINENNNTDVIKQLNDKVVSLSGSAKILLDKYQKQKVIEYINSLPEPDQETD